MFSGKKIHPSDVDLMTKWYDILKKHRHNMMTSIKHSSDINIANLLCSQTMVLSEDIIAFKTCCESLISKLPLCKAETTPL